MDFTSLIADKSNSGSLKAWVNDGAIPSSEIVVDAESFVFEELRCWEMLTTTVALAFTINSNVIALPADFIAPLTFWITGDAKLELVNRDVRSVVQNIAYDSGAITVEQPQSFYWDATNFVFDKRADQAYTTYLVYYARPAALSSGNPTNFLTAKFSRMFRRALVGMAYEWKKDDARATADLQKAMLGVASINAQSQLAMQGMRMGSPLRR